MKNINSHTINYNNLKTELCVLGEKYGTDKSPYNNKLFVNNNPPNRHPYTCFYESIFNNLRHKDIKILEIGVLFGDSIQCWREYFTKAHIIGVDISNYSEKIINSLDNCIFDNIDVRDENSIINILKKYGPFDIIIDDSSHKFNDQIRIINNAYKYLNSDGYLIIEDIFENKETFIDYNEEISIDDNVPVEEFYNSKIKNILDEFRETTFFTLKHDNMYSSGWNNSKLLLFNK